MPNETSIHTALNMRKKRIDDKDRKLIMMLQANIPITTRPYKGIADRLGISENEVILRLKKLKKTGLLKRIDFSFNLKEIGLVSTLVACRIPKRKVSKAKDIILTCKNVTHNYLRKHELNMWFTLTARSYSGLCGLLTGLKEKLKVDKLLSFPTKKIFKLGLRLDVE